MTLGAMLIVIVIVSFLVFFINLNEDRWRHARRISKSIVGLTALVFAGDIILGTHADMVRGVSVDITRAGSRSVVHVDSQPAWFWVSITCKVIGGLVISFVGAKVLKEGLFGK